MPTTKPAEQKNQRRVLTAIEKLKQKLADGLPHDVVDALERLSHSLPHNRAEAKVCPAIHTALQMIYRELIARRYERVQDFKDIKLLIDLN